MRQVVVGERVAVVDLEPAELAPDQVRIEIAYAGICGSELHPLADPDGYGGDAGDGYAWLPSGREEPPGDLAFGHEYSGVVREVGPAVDSVSLGDSVVCLPRWPCTRCRQCRTGDLSRCELFTIPRRGAWADEIVVPGRVVFKVPAAVSLTEAALCEPLSCALRGVDRAGAPAGHTALVIGAGPIGLLTAALAVRSGARKVLVSEPHGRRREIARRLGAVPIDPRSESLGERVGAETDGLGADVVYEAVGRPETVGEAVGLGAPGGKIVVLGVAPPAAMAAISPYRLFARELTLMGAFGPEIGFGRAVGLLPALDLRSIITHVLPLEEVEDAIAIAASGDCGKVLLAP
jgi:2-desacetyl-2-hydroxyethyl bacteriochlorophyllide A dehydrogenase